MVTPSGRLKNHNRPPLIAGVYGAYGTSMDSKLGLEVRTVSRGQCGAGERSALTAVGEPGGGLVLVSDWLVLVPD